jgi:uncharacterized protein (TIGR02996 family)
MSDSPYLRAICEAPFDDGPRLVYADALDERGEAARAEFIRVQCELAKLPHGDHCLPDNHCVHCPDPPRHETLRRRERELLLSPPPGSAYSRAEFWTPAVLRSGAVACEVSTQPPTFRSLQSGMAWGFRRGLVGSVTLTAVQFLGGPCERCEGRGEVDTAPGFGDGWISCPACRGTGRVEGVAAALFAAAPVTEVRLGDREPYQAEGAFWWSLAARPEMSSYLPNELLELLPGGKTGNFSSSNAAHAAVSAAAVALGRDRAELPALARAASADADMSPRSPVHDVVNHPGGDRE